MTFGGRRPLREDDLWWKMTFGEIPLSIEDLQKIENWSDSEPNYLCLEDPENSLTKVYRNLSKPSTKTYISILQGKYANLSSHFLSFRLS